LVASWSEKSSFSIPTPFACPYLLDVGLDNVTILDAITLAATATIPLGQNPRARGRFVGGGPGPAGDCDGDGVSDGPDNCPLEPNPGQADADADGVGDLCDNCPAAANPDQMDGDRNGIGDACQDVDGDGVLDVFDNCPLVPNAGQEDADGDGVGDVCDVCPLGDDAAHGDTDGVPDACDNCPTVSNPGQQDGNAAGIGDACEDRDGDGIVDGLDNCPDDSNLGQADTDDDGVGDVCDDCVDTDHDAFGDPGVPGNVCPDDNCPRHPNPDQADTDGDGIGDLCWICTHMGDAALFGTVAADSIKWKPGAAYRYRYPTPVQFDSDLCARRVSGTGGGVYFDVVAGSRPSGPRSSGTRRDTTPTSCSSRRSSPAAAPC
jgi:hypothetical protein